MSEWTLIIYVLAGGLGTVVFLKIVCDEIVVKNRVLKMRVEIAAEARAKARAQKEAVEVAMQEESKVEVATPAS